MRRPTDRRRSRVSPALAIALGLVVAVALATGALARGVHWVRSQSRQPTGLSFGVSLGPGATVRTAPLPRTDPWASFLAPETICPGRSDATAPPSIQEQIAMCLINYARQRQELPALPPAPQFSDWSALKALDIARCNDFSHTPCGEAADIHARGNGYTGAWGENIFLGPQIYKTPLAAVDGWLNSPHHRENLFRPQWRAQGIAILHLDSFKGQEDVAIWVSEFTDR